METKANHILIGAFILIATIAGFAFVFWMQNYGSGSSVRRYNILFKGPVTGLAPASTVLFNGLKVGKIEEFKIDPKDPRNTLVLVTIRRDIPIRRNSYARIVSQGLSAYSAIMITPGTPDEELLLASAGDKLPVISAAPGGGASSMFEAAPEVLANANSVLRRLDELVANNERLVRDSLKNIEAFTRELESNKARLSAMVENAGGAAQKLNRILKKNEKNIASLVGSVKVTAGNAEKFSNMLAEKRGDIAAIITNIKSASEQFGAIATKLETTLDGLQGFVSDENGRSVMVEVSAAATSFRQLAEKLDKSLGGSADGMARFAKNGLREFEGLMREGRRMVKAMERVMNRIERNPQGLIFGSKQVREYKSN
jgi:phospholipid/cholesterol/gamma-HCH transport system substrate-binding protein